MRAAAIVLVALAFACQVPLQRVPLRVEPDSVALFVDGRRVSPMPAELELRADRAHVLMFKREGYRAERVVLTASSGDSDEAPRLEPAEVSVRLAAIVPIASEVVIERADP